MSRNSQKVMLAAMDSAERILGSAVIDVILNDVIAKASPSEPESRIIAFNVHQTHSNEQILEEMRRFVDANPGWHLSHSQGGLGIRAYRLIEGTKFLDVISVTMIPTEPAYISFSSGIYTTEYV